MNIVDYVYGNMYGWYLNIQLKGRKVDPQRLTAILFGICATAWIAAIAEAYYVYSKKPVIAFNSLLYLILMITFYGITNEIYSRNDRYIKVYKKYAKTRKAQRLPTPIILSFLFFMLPHHRYGNSCGNAIPFFPTPVNLCNSIIKVIKEKIFHKNKIATVPASFQKSIEALDNTLLKKLNELKKKEKIQRYAFHD